MSLSFLKYHQGIKKYVFYVTNWKTKIKKRKFVKDFKKCHGV